jgi:hypothetical protein
VFGDGRSHCRWNKSKTPRSTTARSRCATSTELPREPYRPLLVTFADINDPASVQRVDPDDLAASFGPGYALSQRSRSRSPTSR